MNLTALFRAVAASSDRQSEGEYLCRNCSTAFDVQYHVCPVCGGFSIDPV